MQLYNPRQVILVSCRGAARDRFTAKDNIKDNVLALDWHMPCSFKPFLYAIAVGKTRFSHDMIRNSGIFIVNFMPPGEEEMIIYCGRHSGEHIDKFAEGSIEKEESGSIDCPRIKASAAYLECEVISEADAGDHTIFIGKVLHSEVKKDAGRIFHIDGDEFKPIG